MIENFTHINYGFLVEPKGFSKSLVEQVHGKEIIEVTSASHHDTLLQAPPKADGVFTKGYGVEVHIFTADCMPLLYFSSDADAPVAAVHAGWRGALRGIAKKTLDLLTPRGGEWHVIMGPSLLGCCFEVKDDFVDEFRNREKNIEAFLEKSRGRMFFDLPRYVRQVELGALPDSRVHRLENRCTYCSAPPLPSFRRNGGTDPRIRAWIRKPQA